MSSFNCVYVVEGYFVVITFCCYDGHEKGIVGGFYNDSHFIKELGRDLMRFVAYT